MRGGTKRKNTAAKALEGPESRAGRHNLRRGLFKN
ncbi:hypothetical protein CLOLEP_01490 [[Clostridium] leptum DSM 753]|uniref:Uncharacterized protein n=1 Tax=[Clostridium] leptum DSM 753 TaxID=428125 RepID=A7VSE9_9FIRM|nr:hypothetical protein CLOLEP_01490 [[Clostridium] leptum DSM 753]